jgi:PAS domain S-box-containing protein
VNKVEAKSGKRASAEVLERLLRHNLPEVFEVIDDAVIVIDRDSRVVYVNKGYERIVGTEAERVIGRNLAQLYPNDKLVQVLRTGKPIYYEDRHDDTIGYRILANCLPLKDEEGRIIGAIGIGTSSPIYHLSQRLASFAATTKEKGEAGAPPSRDTLPEPFQHIVGNDPVFVRCLNLAALAAKADCTILLRGETGVGKGLIAEAIHRSSRRAHGPFVSLNCAAIPETLLESELFGYEAGAFTGASPRGKPGKFEEAHGGTLFLDEVGDLSLNMQAKLLRAIETKTIERVGGVRPKTIDTRVIAATNKNLEILVQEQQFRPDLYYRLNVIPIFIPSLRERPADIPPLAAHFLSRFCRAYGKQVVFSPPVFEAFEKHTWPGNVRELINVIEHAVVMCQGAVILPEHLPEYLRLYCGSRPQPTHPQGSSPVSDLRGLKERLEKEAICAALAEARNNRSEAIRRLGISRRTFYKKLRKYGLD